MFNNYIIINIDHINNNFCGGACDNNINEEIPVTLNINGGLNYQYYPKNGKRFESLNYPILNGDSLIINNLRLCETCNAKYLEYHKECYYESLHIEAINIMKKNIKNKVSTNIIINYIKNKEFQKNRVNSSLSM